MNIPRDTQESKPDAIEQFSVAGVLMPERFQTREEWGKSLNEVFEEEPDNTAVILVDVDNLKLANDSLGHTRGDQLLQNVAEIIDHSTRSEDDERAEDVLAFNETNYEDDPLLTRAGGDEFLVLANADGPIGAYKIKTRIKQAFNEYLQREENADLLMAGVGISVGVGSGNGKFSATDVLREADKEMYTEKTLLANTILPSEVLDEIKVICDSHGLRLRDVGRLIVHEMRRQDRPDQAKLFDN